MAAGPIARAASSHSSGVARLRCASKDSEIRRIQFIEPATVFGIRANFGYCGID